MNNELSKAYELIGKLYAENQKLIEDIKDTEQRYGELIYEKDESHKMLIREKQTSINFWFESYHKLEKKIKAEGLNHLIEK